MLATERFILRDPPWWASAYGGHNVGLLFHTHT